MKAKSRLTIKRKLARIKKECFFLLLPLLVLYTGYQIFSTGVLHPVKVLAEFPVVEVEKKVELVKEVEVDRQFKTEKQQIMAYLIEKFGDRADDAIVMIDTCENSNLDPSRMNTGNNNGTWDVGVMQINVDPSDKEEVERLKGWKYNIDRGYEKYKAHNNTFYLWTCGSKVGDYTYLDNLRSKK